MKLEISEPTKRPPVHPTNVEDRIRQRAYELYEQRGRGDGQELNDWAQAEQEVLNSRDTAKAA